MGDVAASPTSSLVLGKRKRRLSGLILQLSGGSVSGDSLSTVSEEEAGPSAKPIIINGNLVFDTDKRYRCTYEGCNKAYRKPSRLEEHERTHTGVRPFKCGECSRTYLRESHLQAHARTHLPESSREFACKEEGCDRRFWTAQHLRRHEGMHSGGKPFSCLEGGCLEKFSKHCQLRSHIALAHCPPGTKPFRCEHEGCEKNFSTSQKLRAHSKTHDERRYVCTHLNCSGQSALRYFPTWSALQAHNRANHPATCPYASCNGKSFSQHKGLRAHLKLHEQREVEEALQGHIVGLDVIDGEPPLKRRRGGEIGRDWKCDEDGCTKAFKSKKALANHQSVTHLGRRDFTCSIEGCGKAFGYKHLLQRHNVRVHGGESNGGQSTAYESSDEECVVRPSAADVLTGRAYKQDQRKLRCPFPVIPGRESGFVPHDDSSHCEFAFSRAYDLRRHLRAVHSEEVEKSTVDRWVKRQEF